MRILFRLTEQYSHNYLPINILVKMALFKTAMFVAGYTEPR